MSQHLRTLLADQIRALRGTLSQAQFGRLLVKPQSVVSRLESREFGKLTLQTLLEIAAKKEVTLIVHFVSHGTFLRMTQDFSEAAYRPLSYVEQEASRESSNKVVDLIVRASKPVVGYEVEGQKPARLAVRAMERLFLKFSTRTRSRSE